MSNNRDLWATGLELWTFSNSGLTEAVYASYGVYVSAYPARRAIERYAPLHRLELHAGQIYADAQGGPYIVEYDSTAASVGSFQLQSSGDGSSWVAVGDVINTAIADPRTVYEVAAGTGPYYRLLCLSATANSDVLLMAAEVRAAREPIEISSLPGGIGGGPNTTGGPNADLTATNLIYVGSGQADPEYGAEPVFAFTTVNDQGVPTLRYLFTDSNGNTVVTNRNSLGSPAAAATPSHPLFLEFSNDTDNKGNAVATPGTITEADFVAGLGYTSGEIKRLELDVDGAAAVVTVTHAAGGVSETTIQPGGGRATAIELEDGDTFSIDASALATGAPAAGNRIVAGGSISNPA